MREYVAVGVAEGEREFVSRIGRADGEERYSVVEGSERA